jgi:hypothetical protein
MNLFTIAAPESHAVLPKLGQKAKRDGIAPSLSWLLYAQVSAAVRVPALIAPAVRMLTSA